VNSVGYYVMMGLLAAGAAYGLANKGKPRPGVSGVQKKVLRLAVCGRGADIAERAAAL